MRIRKALAAVACAIGVAMSCPTSAHAVDGYFAYHTYEGEKTLVDPPTGECINLPEVQDPGVPPAIFAFNGTPTEANVYAGSDCQGPNLVVQPFAGSPVPFGFRSVELS